MASPTPSSDKDRVLSYVEKSPTNDTIYQDRDLPEPGSQARIDTERKLVRKLDFRLMPTIFVIFIMNYIDVRSFV